MRLVFIVNTKRWTKVLAQLDLFEDLEVEEQTQAPKEEGAKSKVDGGTTTLKTGFHSTV